ncbi:DUF5677 domain-containing protein [Clostridium tertium]|uniref:DUF5677 domain-containing protein n=1 Tax=Clostridium tertium TaxID=1559 RepID=UPI002A830436|nr:DUF5677 domain-containing protein [Clostridium tertium]MDY4606388.1 DUF5677 domain-containing protein [Clostridium tertium]
MRRDIQNIIDKYIKRVEKYIADNEGNYNTDILEQIVINLYKELKDVLSENYTIANYQYKELILEIKIMYNLLDELGIRNSKKMFNDNTIGENKADIKTRLFMMFVKTIGEIVFLLEGGYSPCAISRIRYIYEIGVILEFINKDNNEFSKRYFYISERSRINMAREFGDSDLIKRIKDVKKGIISSNKYEKNYSWAKNITNKEQSTFKEIAYLSRYKDIYPIYIESSWYVHADIYGSLVSIDRKTDEPISTWNTEPSKYGTEKVIKYLFLMFLDITNDYFDDVASALSIINIIFIKIISEKVYK